MKVLIETNIVIDVLLKQEPFYKDSFIILQLADSGNIKGIFAAVSMTNVFYILRKVRQDNGTDVYQIMDKISSLFTIAPVYESTISTALSLRWKDFEDAVQYITAKENNVDCIITRNKSDYKNSDIPCKNPTDFIEYFIEKNK